jgi:hypothetical protein
MLFKTSEYKHPRYQRVSSQVLSASASFETRSLKSNKFIQSYHHVVNIPFG